MTTSNLTADQLSQLTGSETWYRHGLNRKVLYTDGVKYLADTGQCYWLVDSIAVAQVSDRRFGRTRFRVWKLAVHPDHSASLTCEDGNGNSPHSADWIYRSPAP
jgi:hypothetical protein